MKKNRLPCLIILVAITLCGCGTPVGKEAATTVQYKKVTNEKTQTATNEPAPHTNSETHAQDENKNSEDVMTVTNTQEEAHAESVQYEQDDQETTYTDDNDTEDDIVYIHGDVVPLPTETPTLEDVNLTLPNIYTKRTFETEGIRLYEDTATNGTKVWWAYIPRDFQPNLIIPESGVTGKETPPSVYERTGADLIINAGIWNVQNGIPLGIVAEEDDILSELGEHNDDVLVMTKGGILLSRTMTAKNYTDSDVSFAVKGFHPIIEDYERTKEDWPDRHPRTFIGQLRNGSYIVGVTGGRGHGGIGMNYDELYDFIHESIPYDVKFMYNLDGGGSTCMVYEGEIINEPTDGHTRAVANCIAFYNDIDAKS